MTDAYAIVRNELSSFICEFGISNITEKHIDCTGRVCGASVWLGLSPDKIEMLSKRLRMLTIVEAAQIRDGRVEIAFSRSFYDDMLSRIDADKLFLPMPDDVVTREQYAYVRMRMLSRRGGCGVPDIMQPAFWRALGLAEKGLSTNTLKHRLSLTANEVLAQGRGLLPEENHNRLSGCGSAAEGIAKLMYFAITQLK